MKILSVIALIGLPILLVVINWDTNGHRPLARKVVLTAALGLLLFANLWAVYHGR